MTRVVVDASVIFAALIADGPTRGLLLGSREIEYYTPDVVAFELERHLPEASRRSKKPVDIVRTLVRDILSNVEVVPLAAYAAFLPVARDRAKTADARGDEAYIALSGALAAPVWTYDKDFRRVTGLRVLATSDIVKLSEGFAAAGNDR